MGMRVVSFKVDDDLLETLEYDGAVTRSRSGRTLYLVGRATECEAHLAMYVLHRLGICKLHGDWRYRPCVWADECETSTSGEFPRSFKRGGEG